MIDDWGVAVKRDFIRLFCGELIGEGSSRQVYELEIDPTKVVKVETGAQSFQNIIEWETWNEVRHTKWSGWFAPCLWISPCGIAMIQARTTPIKKAPKEIPNFFTDLKLSNFGRLKGRFSCHDYGLNLLASNGLARARMKKAELL